LDDMRFLYPPYNDPERERRKSEFNGEGRRAEKEPRMTPTSARLSDFKPKRAKIFAFICLAASLWAIERVAGYGIAGYLMNRAVKQNSLEQADAALRWFSSSADLYKSRGNIFSDLGDQRQAAAEFEKSLKIRPADHYAWFQLGYARQESGDSAGALKAYREAVRLAPGYALPRWNLGQLAYQNGDREEGWKQIRVALAQDNMVLLNALRFAWGETRGSASGVEQALRLDTPLQKLVFGLFLAEQGDTISAATYLCYARDLTPEQRAAVVARMIGKNEIRLAYSAHTGQCVSGGDWSPLSGGIINPGFEEDIRFDRNNFDWQIGAGEKNIRVTRDGEQPAEGRYSLKIDFKGEVKKSADFLKQLIVVEERSRYRLTFLIRLRDMTTDAYPQLTVRGAENGAPVLAQSGIENRPEKSNGAAETNMWETRIMEFETPERSEAVWISVRQADCRYRACPIFGSIWIDDLKLEKIK
jgi:tetratricopeptide (TPR) repeat protein